MKVFEISELEILFFEELQLPLDAYEYTKTPQDDPCEESVHEKLLNNDTDRFLCVFSRLWNAFGALLKAIEAVRSQSTLLP